MPSFRIIIRRSVLLTMLLAIAGTTASVRAGNCTWNIPPTTVSYGNYSVFAPSPLTVTTPFQIQCTPFTTGTVRLTRGANSATFDPRTMVNPLGETLPYNLYNDSAMSLIWGDGTGGSTVYEAYNGTPKDKVFNDYIYARMPIASDVRAGTYTDSITAVLSWGTGASSSVTFTVTVTVIPECSVRSFAIAFGNYDPVVMHAASPLDATGSVQVFCTKGTAGTVALSAGSNAAGSIRRMAFGAERLTYNVFLDGSRVIEWNDTNRNSGTAASMLTPIGGGFTAYGRIPSNQDVSAGSYSDTITATVNY